MANKKIIVERYSEHIFDPNKGYEEGFRIVKAINFISQPVGKYLRKFEIQELIEIVGVEVTITLPYKQ